MLRTLQIWCASKRTHEKIFPLQASIVAGPVMGQDETRSTVWLRSVWLQSCRTSERTICKFLVNFENTTVGKQDIGPLLQEYAESRRLMSQPQEEKAIVNFWLWANQWHHHYSLATNLLGAGTLMRKNISLRWVYSDEKVRHLCAIHCQCSSSRSCSVFAETMKLLANSSCSYQIRDRSRWALTKYTNDEKTHAVINNKMFKRLAHVNIQLYEVELAECEIECEKPFIVRFFAESWVKGSIGSWNFACNYSITST